MEFSPSSLPFPRIDLHNEKLRNSFSPLNANREKKSRRMRWADIRHMWGEEKYTQNFSRGKSEHNGPRVRSWIRCDDNIKMNQRANVGWIHEAQDRASGDFVGTQLWKFEFHKTVWNFLISCQFLNKYSVLQICRIKSLSKYPIIESLKKNSNMLSSRFIPQHCRTNQRYFGNPITRAATNKSTPMAKTSAWTSRRPLAITNWSLRPAINLLRPR
jgi:hypothetical protein